MEPRQPMVQLRISGVAESLRRSRLAFLASTIISVAVIISLWNAYFSWYRGFALQSEFAKDTVTIEAQKQVMGEWVRNQTISIQLLGIHVGVSDAAALVPPSLLIVTIWFFYCSRRENHTIGSLLIDTKNDDLDTQQMVYHGITAHLVFLDTSGIDEPMKDLAMRHYSGAIPLIRLAVKSLIFLPSATILFVVLADILTIFLIPAAFRDPVSTNGVLVHEPLFNAIVSSPDKWYLCIWVAFFEVFALLVGLAGAFLCARIIKFEHGTGSILREYYHIIVAKQKIVHESHAGV